MTRFHLDWGHRLARTRTRTSEISACRSSHFLLACELRSDVTPGALPILLLVHLLAGCASSEEARTVPTKNLDIDGDGFVTREEYALSDLSAFLKFEELDADRDGLLSERELEFRYSERGQRGERGEGKRGGQRRGSRPNSSQALSSPR